MADPAPREAFLQSVHRCAESPDFICTFYERFTARSDEVRAMFRDADIEVQHAMLLRSLYLLAGVNGADPDALQELNGRAVTHDRWHLAIPPSLYAHWLAAMIETASEFDPEWGAKLEKIWTWTLEFATDYMARRY